MDALVQIEHSRRGRDLQDEGDRVYDTAIPIVFLKRRHRELCNAEFTVLHGMADPLLAGRGILTVAGNRNDYRE